MGEIAVVSGGHKEHTELVDGEAGDRKVPVEWDDKDQKRNQVDQHERQAGNNGDARAIGQRDRQLARD